MAAALQRVWQLQAPHGTQKKKRGGGGREEAKSHRAVCEFNLALISFLISSLQLSNWQLGTLVHWEGRDENR